MRIPCSPNKRYLTGIDWLVALFDRALKNVSNTGNAAQIVAQLDGRLDEDLFRRDMAAFCDYFPVLCGRIARDINLAPYWKIPARPEPAPFSFAAQDVAESLPAEEVLATLAMRVNDPFPDESRHLAFHVARQGRRQTFLTMVFDHRLFDARGAEAFLALFEEWRRTREIEPLLSAIEMVEPAHLSHWRKKFAAGKTANRAIRQAAALASPFFDPAAMRDARTAFRFFRFDPDQSRAVEAAAFDEAGYLMLSPFLLAACMRTLHRVLVAKGLKPPAYIVPISIDQRRPGAWRSQPFFNRVSFMFLTVPAVQVDDRQSLIRTLTEQIYEQTKARVPQCFAEASMLMRIAPLGILARLARRPLKGEFGTMSFSHVGETLLTAERFAQCPLRNVYHAPRVPIPTGLGFFFNRFRNRLNLTLSYLPGLLNEDDLARLEKDLLFFRDNPRSLR